MVDPTDELTIRQTVISQGEEDDPYMPVQHKKSPFKRWQNNRAMMEGLRHATKWMLPSTVVKGKV